MTSFLCNQTCLAVKSIYHLMVRALIYNRISESNIISIFKQISSIQNGINPYRAISRHDSISSKTEIKCY